MDFPKYQNGDRVKDLTFDPAPIGTVIKAHDRPDAYWVRLEGSKNEVLIHARNLQAEGGSTP